MNVTKGGITLAALVMLGVSGAATAREPDRMASRPKGYPKGFHQPKFTSDIRVTGTPQPYAWPVGDRYRAESRPYFGRAY